MADTLLEMSRRLRLYIPQLPITLAEQFIRDRYRRILERRDWSAMKQESEFIIDAAKSDGTVLVTRKSDSVVGTDTSFDITDIGRQFKVGSSPIYTIVNVDIGTQTLELDRSYGDVTAATTTYKIFTGFVSPPEDFLRFEDIVDYQRGWRLWHNITSHEINAMDPMRLNFGDPYIVADRMYDLGNQPQYELWPYCTANKTIYYTYYARPVDLLRPIDEPIFPIRSDAIVAGALADAARWPGTKTDPNPYFSRPDYWKTYEAEFEDKMIEIERRDEDLMITQLQQDRYAGMSFYPISANFLMNHAIR